MPRAPKKKDVESAPTEEKKQEIKVVSEVSEAEAAQTPIKDLNLFQKLAKIRSMSDVVRKDKDGFGYTYADIVTILANITAGMKKYGVSLIPQIVPDSTIVQQNVVTNTKVDKTGKSNTVVNTEMLVTANMIFRWINDDRPSEYLDVPWFMTGAQKDPSQAFGSGLTYCTRYFLTNFFQIAQSDTDVDAYRSKQKEAEVSEERAIAEEIIGTFDSELKVYLADNPKNNEAVKKFITRYVKNANYFTIKDPVLAAKLLNEFKETFVKKEEGK